MVTAPKILVLLLLLLAPATAQPGLPAGIDESVRERVEEEPLRYEALYIVDALSNVKGGVERGSQVLGNLNLVLDLDAEQAFGWKGASFHTYMLANHGNSFSRYVGDFQTVSHIEAPTSAGLLEAYFQQKFFDDRLSLLAGLYAVDSEFDTRSCSGLFVHSSPGTGGDLGQIGVNGPGIFPVGALGARLRYDHADWYGQVAVVEGVPGDGDGFGTSFKLDGGEGVLTIGEAGHLWEDKDGELGKAALGAWRFSRPYETFLDPQEHATNQGAYLSLEKTFSREQDAAQGLAAYLRVGVAEGRINPIQTFVGAALVYTGPFAGRDQDRLGFAVNSGFTGGDYRRFGDFETHETALELTYSFFINENFSLQPDLQYVLNPGFDRELDNALVLGLRAVFWAGN